jgi:hypothetical protein
LFEKKEAQKMAKFRILSNGIHGTGRFLDKTLFCLLAALLFSAVIHAQEKAGQISLGLSPEINMATRSGIAAGGGLYADYAINAAWAAGIKTAVSYNFEEIVSLEPAAFVRWYIPFDWKVYPFAQADLGAMLIWEGSRMVPAILGGIGIGLRFPINRLFVEPYAAFGFPFVWRAGLAVGGRFKI